jgi:hypothetical protein
MRERLASRFRLRRLVAAVALSSVVSLLLASCFYYPGPLPNADELVGTWVNGETELALDADRTFVLSEAPGYTKRQMGRGWLEAPSPVWSDSGEWQLDEASLHLNQTQLFVDFNGSEVVLEFALAVDTDNPRCFELVREGSSLEPALPDTCYLDG